MGGHALADDVRLRRPGLRRFPGAGDVQLPIQNGTITAFIGPSRCGTSTALRCLNRMNDLIRGFRFDGACSLAGLEG